MAVDLATSGSLGYGIGLQAKVPDKTNLVLQLENQRLKRQALENQAQEEEAQKAAKQEQMFQKAINVDTTKWHRTLVGKVNQAANEAINEYSRLYAENPRVAQNSINQIMRKFNEQVGQLNTANEQRKQMHKFLNDKVSQNKNLIGDEKYAYNYLNTGDDLSLSSAYTTPFGEYTFNPDSTVLINAIGQSDANTSAVKAALDPTYYTEKLSSAGLGNIQVDKDYTDAQVANYMANRYQNNPSKRIEDMATISPDLEAVFDASGLKSTGMTFNDFINPKNQVASSYVDRALLNYHKNLLTLNKGAVKTLQFNADDELNDAAKRLTQSVFTTPTGEYLVTSETISPARINDAWNNYKQTPRGKIAIEQFGGEKEAKRQYENYVRKDETRLRQLYKPSGVAGAKGEDWVIEDITAVRPKILNAQQLGSIRGKREELADREKRKAEGLEPLLLSEEEVVSGVKDFSGLEKETPSKQFRVDPTGMREAYFSVIPTTLNRVQGWSTGDTTPQFDIINGTFRSVLLDKQGNPKFIIIDEQEKPGVRSNTWAVPFELNKSVLGGYSNLLEKKKPTTKPAQQKKATTTTTTKTKGLTGGNVR